MATKNGVTLHKRSAVPGKVPLTTDLELGQLGINTNDGKVYLKKDDGAESVVQVGDDRVRWAGYWANTTYQKNDMVFDDPWTMIAIRETSDRASPQPFGDPINILGDNPTWDVPTPENQSVVYSGMVYVFNEGGWLTEVKAWVPELSETTNYRFVIEDITDPANPLITNISEPVLSTTGWTTILTDRYLIRSGSVLRIYTDALNTGSSTNVSGGWVYSGRSNSGAPVTPGGWNNNNGNTIVRIDKTDLDSNDRTSELLGVISGSDIRFVQTSNTNNFVEYRTTGAPVDQGTYIEYTVTLSDSNGTIGTSENCTVDIDIPIALATQYNKWTDGVPVTIPSFPVQTNGYLVFDGVEQNVPQDAFGIDIEFQRATVSEDWEIVSTIGSGVTTGGGSGGDGVPEAPSDGNQYARKDGAWEQTMDSLLFDTNPQLGGNLDINDAVLSNQTGNDIEINGDLKIFSKDKTTTGGYIKLSVDPGATGGATGFVFETSAGGLGADTSYLDGDSLRVRSLSKIDYQSFGNDVQFNTGGGNLLVGNLSGSSHYTFPPDRGTDGQVLVTDANGLLSWQNPSGGWEGTATSDLDMNNFAITNGLGNVKIGNDTNLELYTTGGQTRLQFLSTQPGGEQAEMSLRPGICEFVADEVEFQIDCYGGGITLGNAGAQYLTLRGSNWPSGTGTDGQVLTTDGAGTLSWATPSGGGGGWEGTAASNLDMNGFVITDGTGDTTIKNILDVTGDPNSDTVTVSIAQDTQAGFPGFTINGTDGSLKGDYRYNVSGNRMEMRSLAPMQMGNFSPNLDLNSASVTMYDNAYAFPNADGSADQVLTTNGAGALSWSSPAQSLINSIQTNTDVVEALIEAVVTKNVTVAPSNPEVGDQYYDATHNKPLWWSGTDWLDARGRRP